MVNTSEDRLATVGHFTPTYLTLERRASVSRYTATPILEEYNTVYGYWATARDLLPLEIVQYLGPTYLRNHREWRD